MLDDLKDKLRRQSSSNSNTLRSNRGYSIEKTNIWYGKTNSIDFFNEDIYSGISVDKPSILYDNHAYKVKDMNSFATKKSNGSRLSKKNNDTYDNLPSQSMNTKNRSGDMEKSKLFVNDSEDVDDNKLVGILV